MRPLRESIEWPPLAVYDIESVNWVEVVLLCHLDELGNKVHFKTVGQYIDWLWDDFKGQHVWAHAGGRFDHRFLLPEMNRRGWDFKAAMSGGSIVLLTVTHGGKKMQFADSFRIMPNALKAIGKTIGIEKIEVDRAHIEALSEADAITYCYRDCEIALKGLQYMKKALVSVRADFAFTLASIASRWVRRSPAIDFDRFYSSANGKLEYDSEMEEADKWCLPAYFGGRCEVFKRGNIKGPVYYYDIVSSYPCSMQFELPLYFKGFIPAPARQTKAEIEQYLSHSGITEATVTIPRMRVGPLAIRHDGRLSFPTGKLLGRWTNIELLEALRIEGVKVELHGQARFEGVPFLGNFVKTFYELRKQAKKEKDAFLIYAYKIFLNSLYGKLVETIDRSSYVTSRWELERAKKAGAEVRHTKVTGVYCVHSQEQGPFRHVAAGAYVTAYSRLRLLAGLQAVLKNGGEVYYCDTDSIMTNVQLPELQGIELGEWQHEYTFQDLEIVLPKVYRATLENGERLYRCKGVPIVREHEPPDFPELRWEAFKRYAKTQDPAMAALLTRDGLSGFVADINAGTLKPRRLPLLRCLKGEDKKRDWTGQDSWPLHMELVK